MATFWTLRRLTLSNDNLVVNRMRAQNCVFRVENLIGAKSNDSVKAAIDCRDRRCFSLCARDLKREADLIFESMLATENKTIEVSKLINPKDADILGNTHGGHVLSLLEEAGMIAAMRHFNKFRDPKQSPCVACLVRMENVVLLAPIHVGDVVEVDSEVTYTSKHSCEVCVTLEAMSTMRGDMQRRLTTTAYMWFVAVHYNSTAKAGHQSASDGDSELAASIDITAPLKGSFVPKLTEMPQLEYSSPEMEAAGRLRYERQLKERSNYESVHHALPSAVSLTSCMHGSYPKGTVRFSQLVMSHSVQVDDCNISGMMRGGALLKLADETSAAVAWGHAGNICLAASVDSCNFRFPIFIGTLLFLDCYVTFTSQKTMEVECVVHAKIFDPRDLEYRMKFNVFNALMTFVALDKTGKALDMRPLLLETEQEKHIFAQGRQRYELRKQQRQMGQPQNSSISEP